MTDLFKGNAKTLKPTCDIKINLTPPEAICQEDVRLTEIPQLRLGRRVFMALTGAEPEPEDGVWPGSRGLVPKMTRFSG